MAGMAADRGINGALEWVRATLAQRPIGLVDPTVPEGLLQHAVRMLALRHHHEPRGTHIETLHDSLSFSSPRGGHLYPGGSQVRDHIGAVPAQRGMGRNTGRLVHNHQIGIFVNDAQPVRQLGVDVRLADRLADVDLE